MLTLYHLKLYIYISFHRVRIKNEPGFLPWFFFVNPSTSITFNFNAGFEQKRFPVSYLYI